MNFINKNFKYISTFAILIFGFLVFSYFTISWGFGAGILVLIPFTVAATPFIFMALQEGKDSLDHDISSIKTPYEDNKVEVSTNQKQSRKVGSFSKFYVITIVGVLLFATSIIIYRYLKIGGDRDYENLGMIPILWGFAIYLLKDYLKLYLPKKIFA